MAKKDDKNIKPIKFPEVNKEARKKLDMRSGDTVRVFQIIQEKGKTRNQVFEGAVLARKHGTESGATFTVRKVAEGVGVERIFPLYSPTIDKIEVVKRAKVRRSKLYYIRTKAAKEVNRQMRGGRAMTSQEEPVEEAIEVEEVPNEAEAPVLEPEVVKAE